MPAGRHTARDPETASQAATAPSLPLPESDTVAPAGEGLLLSMRAVNVLKLLAPELLGETPPLGEWTPPDALLRRITIKMLMTARNCGPQTTAEILSFAESRGIAIQPKLRFGRSLQATWRDLDARFAEGRVGKAEIAEALEKSVRRKSTRIPVAVQKILLAMLGLG